jgi:hypothetical protein
LLRAYPIHNSRVIFDAVALPGNFRQHDTHGPGTESCPPERWSSQIRRSRYSVLQKAKPGWSTKDLLKVLGQKAKGELRRHMEKSVFLLTIFVIQLLRINHHLNE